MTSDCNVCSSKIDDAHEDSIKCDACNAWVHARKECSGIKKTIFKLMSKNDVFTCQLCFQLAKMYHIDIGIPIDRLKLEMRHALELNNELDNKNKGLMSDLRERELRIADLEKNLREALERCEVLEGSEAADGLLGDENRRDYLDFPPLPTSNRFQVWSGSEECERGSVGHLEGREATAYHSEGKIKRSGNARRRVRRRRVQEERENGPATVGVNEGGRLLPRSRPHRQLAIVSDSQGRGCAKRLHNCMSDGGWGSEMWMMPGAEANTLIETAGGRGSELRDSDFLVVVAGVNGVCEDSVNVVSEKLDDLASRVSTSNVVFVEAPWTYDKDLVSNNYIKDQNIVIENKCSEKGWTFLHLNCLLDRNSYTRHGLHLNHRGKRILIDLVSNHILSLEGKSHTTSEGSDVQGKNIRDPAAIKVT